MSILSRIGVALLCVATLPLHAQTARSVADGYEDRIKGARTIAALGADLFGEEINLKDGTASFSATDIVVPTNSGLRVQLGRRLGINARDWDENRDSTVDGELFGNWKLDTPYINAVFDETTGWVSSMPNPQQRCSVSGANMLPPPARPSLLANGLNTFYPEMYWSGPSINVPGSGSEPLLYLPAGRARPNDGRAYYGSTKSNWRVSCLPSLKNGSGEGFLVVLPDGTRYYFDWISFRRFSPLKDRACNTYYGCRDGIGMYRREYFLHASRVEDRFGNWVAYTYSATNPRQLLRIESNDGAYIGLQYAGNKIVAASSSVGTWSYLYADAARTQLSAVQQPDGAQWNFVYDNINPVAKSLTGLIWHDCAPVIGGEQDSPPPAGQALHIRHPAGATGIFRFRKLNHGTDNTPGGCWDPDPDRFGDEEVTPIVSVYRVASLYEKSVSGPGVPTMTWTYRYEPSGSWSANGGVEPDCSALPPGPGVYTTVTAPDGVVTRYAFGNDYWCNAGQLLEIQTSKGGELLRKESKTYLNSAAGQCFADDAGTNPNWTDNPFFQKNRPQLTNVITELGRSYTRRTNTFDCFARPTSVRRLSAPASP